MHLTINLAQPESSHQYTLSAQTVVSQLDKALNGKFFSVCPLDIVGEIYGVRRPHDALLQSMHCVAWEQMTAQQQNYAVNTTLALVQQMSGHRIVVV